MKFREIDFNEAKSCIRKHHYAPLNSGRFCYGIENDGAIVAAAVFVDHRSGINRIGEVIATAKDPKYTKLHMSHVLKCCYFALANSYDMLISYVETSRARGVTFQGAHWNYHGIGRLGDYSLPPEKTETGWHLYWKPLSKKVKSNLQNLTYPHE